MSEFLNAFGKLNPKPSQALFGFLALLLLAAFIEIFSEKLPIIAELVKPVLGIGALLLIRAAFGIPDLWNDWNEKKQKRQIIRGLSVSSKDFLWSILVPHRRTIKTAKCPAQLEDHYIVRMNNRDEWGTPIIYEITEVYWPLLEKEGLKLIYEDEHQPSNPK